MERLFPCEAIGIVGKEALDSWDAEGRALYDIEAESWIIEAKATRSDPERVWLSDPEQVNWRIHKPILLAVTRMNRGQNTWRFVSKYYRGIDFNIIHRITK